jgi:hypothetical protein
MLLKTVASAGPEGVKAFSGSCHSDDGQIEIVTPDHRLKRRENLLVCQISSGAEEHKCI